MADETVTKDEFIALRTDVKAILDLLEGSIRFGLKGLPERVNDNEGKIQLNGQAIKEVENDFNNFQTKIIAWTAGAATVATAVVQFALSYFT